MSEVLEEFITLTPLTCVQQVNALLDATSSKPRSCKVFYALFSVYCGVLVYRAYRTYSATQKSGVGVAQNLTESLQVDNKVEETIVAATPSHFSEQLAPETSPILLQPADFSNTDMRWRYGPQTAAEFKQEEENFQKTSNESNQEPEVATASVGTSTKGKSPRTHGDKLEGDPAQTTYPVGS